MNILSSEQGKKARALARKAIVYFIVMQVTVEGQLKKHPVLPPLPFPQEIFQMFLERE